jgi:flagellar basal-body rod protein FlgC
MDILPGSNITASALNAEKLRMQIIAQNIANAHTTMTASGEPYRRQAVAFEAAMDRSRSLGDNLSLSELKGVRVSEILEDRSDFRRVFEPNHPHADARGFIAMPNVDTAIEMVDMISSSRSYEANLAVMKTSRQLAKQALAISF